MASVDMAPGGPDAAGAGGLPGQAAKPASFLARLSWAFFDWANQPYFTVVTTFIFAPYFTSQVVGDPAQGQALMGYISATAAAIIALGAPFLGAIADAGGRRKPWLFFFQVLLAAGCFALWLAQPGLPGLLPLVIGGLILASIGAEYSILFNNALLPGLTTPERIGRLSGFGWGMGYLGGLVMLFGVLIVARPELIGITPPEGEALLGLKRASFEAERLTGPLAALWQIIFVLPMFLFTPDRPGSGKPMGQVVRAGILQVLGTIRHLRQHRNLMLFLIAFMIYNDGLNAVIAFGGIYAAGVFGWGTTELGIFGIVLNVVGIAGVMFGGWLDDKIGSKPTVRFAILSVGLGTLGILSLTPSSVLFFLDVAPRAAGAGAFSSTGERFFFLFALLLGLGFGPMQAASRTMVARLAPKEMIGEFYGLFSFSGRATAFLAPLMIAIATDITGTQRVGVLVMLAFLVAGLLLLGLVKEPERSKA